MFHLAANFVALANTADTDVPALADSILYIQNGHHVPPKDVMLMAAYSGAVTLLRTKLVTPKTRQVFTPYINPITPALLPPTDPNVADYRANPFTLRAQEEIAYQSTDSAAGPNNHYIISWLTDIVVPIPRGDIYTIRATSTTAAVASTWTDVALTYESTLPAGTYAMIGGSYNATNAVAFQCIFDNQFWRPGGLGGASAGIRAPWFQNRGVLGGLGVWGYFNTVTLPRARVLNDSTDNAHTFYFDFVRVAAPAIP